MSAGTLLSPSPAASQEPPPPEVAQAAPAPDAITVQDVGKSYGPAGNHVLALRGLSLHVARGEFMCLVGASGCGKTTLLNLLAGLDRAQTGTISLQGRVALLFQEPALFPWLTARQNVELALRLAGAPKHERREEARRLLALVRLADFENRLPHQLSGGMQQRVSLARALAQQADILLMDEPFGSLDAMTRDLLHEELERIWLGSGLTVLFVTHDVREAVRLGDRVAVLTSRPGRLAHQVSIGLPRPRPLGGSAVSQLTDHITGLLRAEVGRHADQ